MLTERPTEALVAKVGHLATAPRVSSYAPAQITAGKHTQGEGEGPGPSSPRTLRCPPHHRSPPFGENRDISSVPNANSRHPRLYRAFVHPIVSRTLKIRTILITGQRRASRPPHMEGTVGEASALRYLGRPGIWGSEDRPDSPE